MQIITEKTHHGVFRDGWASLPCDRDAGERWVPSGLSWPLVPSEVLENTRMTVQLQGCVVYHLLMTKFPLCTVIMKRTAQAAATFARRRVDATRPEPRMTCQMCSQTTSIRVRKSRSARRISRDWSFLITCELVRCFIKTGL